MNRFLAAAFCVMATLAGWEAAAADKNPYLRVDNSLITLNGIVQSVSANAFVLDYGDGEVLVEMDDLDRDADGYKLVKGDKVRVTGMIDDDAFETTKIEAGSVFVENIGTYVFANAADEEDTFPDVVAPVVVAATVVQGRVAGVSGRTFMLDTGARKLKIDTSAMSYDPLDDEGYQKIEKGDRVSVSGKMDRNFWGKREPVADSVITISSKKRREPAQTSRKGLRDGQRRRAGAADERGTR